MEENQRSATKMTHIEMFCANLYFTGLIAQ
jgi:hypothetical protein